MNDTTDKYTVADVFKFMVAGEPLELQKAVGDVMVDKVNALVDQRRSQVAASLFGQELPDQVDGETGEEDED